MSEKRERRCYEIANIRAKEEDGKRSIGGYAAVFDKPSENLGVFRTVYEKIRKGAFSRTLKEGADVRAFWNHNSDIVLGRTTAGTLRLAEDDIGLSFDLDLPDTQAGRDAFTLIQRGDVTGMSFGFEIRAEEKQLPDEPEDPIIRTLVDVELFEISPVVFPAYPDTEVSVRSVDEWVRKIIEEEEQKGRKLLANQRNIRLVSRGREARLQRAENSALARGKF